MTYSEKLRDPRWQKKRLKVFEDAGWKCKSCGRSSETLHVHHLVYSKGEPWDAPDHTLECLCSTCHDNREQFNEFWGRSLVPTSTCLSFWCLFTPAFNGDSEAAPKLRRMSDLYQEMERLRKERFAAAKEL